MIVSQLRETLGAQAVLTDADMAPWTRDWTGHYAWTPLCVVRPASTEEVARVIRLAGQARVPVVPVGGNTGLVGGTKGEGAIMLSLDRMRRIVEIRPEARLARVEAGVVLEDLHRAAAEHGLRFPMTFGAKGSATLGGMLATNAGGSNVLRYGNTRDLALGIEAVLPDGQVVDLMGGLHKDNSGLSLRDLLIGAEGTLGVITAAMVKLTPEPRAHATALLAVPDLPTALVLLQRLQDASDGGVEAYEYMDRVFMRTYAAHTGQPELFENKYDVNILVELAAFSARDADPDSAGATPVQAKLEACLAEASEEGLVLDAVLAQSDAQRAALWALRESAAELTTARKPLLITDISVALDRVSLFRERMDARLFALDPEAEAITVGHLGDGNIHYSIWPSQDGAAHKERLIEALEDVVRALEGSFSAEHGIGLSKLSSMARRKDPVALAAMRAIKSALDPQDLMNPGKFYPG